VAAIPHAAASTVGYALHPCPELVTLSDGCASGLDAINAAARRIMAGRYDIAFAGATDSSITPYTVESLIRCGACLPTDLPPERASRPFDRRRTSGIVAEGAGMLVLENADHAAARGARVYAAIAGFGSSADPRDEPEGYGMGTSMRMALANAGRLPSDIDYVNAHAPSDVHMDRAETTMIKRVFGRRAYEIPVGSIKGATGCPMGAAGVHQVIASALALHQQTVPPTTNFEQGDDACDLDYVPGAPRRARLRGAMINSHGFGRGNASMMLESAG
jgi:3-oxoacyl-(acyl-carrier-protein) synthase